MHKSYTGGPHRADYCVCRALARTAPRQRKTPLVEWNGASLRLLGLNLIDRTINNKQRLESSPSLDVDALRSGARSSVSGRLWAVVSDGR
jgi:hypothetical protein